MSVRWKIAQWFELRWWRKYLRGKDKAAYLQWKRDYWNNLLSKTSGVLDLARINTVVDLGCGPAGIFIALPGKEIIAVDPLLAAYEKQTAFFSRNDYPTVTFVNSTMEEFNANSCRYDLVCCMNAINHVRDIEKGFEQIRSLCSVNGIIMVSIDAHNYRLFKHLFRLVPGDILHPHQYDLAEYKNLTAGGSWQIAETILLKKEFFFNHYLLVAKR